MASAWKTFMDMASLIAASLLAGRLLGPDRRDPTLIVLVMIGLLAISTVITILGTKEKPTDRTEGGPRFDIRRLRAQFRIDLRANTAYWWLIVSRLLYLIGIYGVQAFAQYYLQDVLRVPDPPKQTGDLLASLTITLIVLVLIGGWLSDRFGAKRVLYAACTITIAGMLLMLTAKDMGALLLFGSVLGAGIGLFLTANWALATRLAPQDEAGKFLGLTNLATAGSGALARLEGPMIDLLNGVWPGLWAGYTAMFLFGAASAFLSMLLLRKINHR